MFLFSLVYRIDPLRQLSLSPFRTEELLILLRRRRVGSRLILETLMETLTPPPSIERDTR
jgi:hypothetical protein